MRASRQRPSIPGRGLGLLVAACLLVGAACGDGGGTSAPEAADGLGGVAVPDGFEVTVLVDGLDGPTQVVEAPDGRLLVAQLNGGERDGTGQVVAVDPAAPDGREVLVDGLRTPTGVEVLDGELWVMEQRTLSRGPLTGGDRRVVLDDLPYNGRSEGTLTAVDGALLYDTSGALADGEVVDGSGVLWSLVPGEDPTVVAGGFKHAYARTVDADGTLWQTEVSDGRFDGGPAPDELVAVVPGGDGGWPRCIGDRQPVVEQGATAATCAGALPSHALFAPGATPTSVAVAPWDPEVLLVALWADGEVVAVPRGGAAPVAAAAWLTGIEHPQHLLAVEDRLLVVDHGGGRILAVERTAG